MTKMFSNVRYSSLASGGVEATVTIFKTADTVARVWVSEYELLKLSRSGCLILFEDVHYDEVALAEKCLVLSRECLPSLCHNHRLWIQYVGEMRHGRYRLYGIYVLRSPQRLTLI
jgi:hypothetical protein